MPRQSQRFTYPPPMGSIRHPFTGLVNRIPGENQSPATFIAASNVENIGGTIRSRAGYDRHEDQMLGSGNALAIYGIHAIQDATLSTSDEIIAKGVRVSGGTYNAYFRWTGSAWSELIAGTNAGGTPYDDLTSNRPTFTDCGGWTIITEGTGYEPLAYARISGTSYMRRAGLPAPRTSDTSSAWDIDGYDDTPLAYSKKFDVALSSTGAGAVIPAGTYEYRFTWYDTRSELESSLMDFSGSATAGPTITHGAGVLATRLTFANVGTFWADGANEDRLFANRVKIYRNNGTSVSTSATWHLVGTYDISAGAGTFDDTTHPDDLGTLAQAPTLNHEPPSNVDYACLHRDRVFYVPAFSRTVYYSRATDQLSGRAGGEYVPVNYFFTIPEGGIITGIASFGADLLVFQEDAVWRVDTSLLPEEPYKLRLRDAVGCASHWTIARNKSLPEAASRLYWANDIGAYEFDGGSTLKISNDIPDTWKTILGSSQRTNFTWYHSTGWYDPFRDRYMLSVGTSDDASFLTILVYDTQTNSWLPWKLGSANDNVRAATQVIDGNKDRWIYAGTSTGRIIYFSQVESQFSDDNGTAIAWNFRLPWLDLGDSSAHKHVYEVILQWSGAASGTVALDVYLDGESSAAVSNSTAIASGDPKETVIYVGGDCRRISVKASGTTASFFYLTGVTITFDGRRLRG